MPKQIVPLSDIKIKNAKTSASNQKLFDGGGPFLLITPTGGKLWRLKYRFGGTEKALTLGTYPQTTLAEASQKRLDAKSSLEKDIDPGAVKKAQKGQIPKKLKLSRLSPESGTINFLHLGQPVMPTKLLGGWSCIFSPGWVLNQSAL
jgi:hypothetical protein